MNLFTFQCPCRTCRYYWFPTIFHFDCSINFPNFHITLLSCKHKQIRHSSFFIIFRRQFQSNNMWVNRLHRGRIYHFFYCCTFFKQSNEGFFDSKGATLFILCLAMHYRDNKGNIINYVRQILRLDIFIVIAVLFLYK